MQGIADIGIADIGIANATIAAPALGMVVLAVVLMAIAVFLLGLTDPQFAFERIVCEVISALGTVGLSMGITGDLSDLGKLIIIILMTAGRVGILTFGIAIAMHDETRSEEADNELLI